MATTTWTDTGAYTGGEDNAPAAAGASYPWLPMFGAIELADFQRLDNYITAVTDHGDGEMTLTLDKAQNRNFPGNGELLELDFGGPIKTAGSQTHIVEMRITFITRPTTLTGTPYVALYHTEGAGSRTGVGPCMCLMMAASDSAKLLTGVGATISAGTSIGTIDSWNAHFIHANGGIAAVNRYSVVVDAHGGTDTNQRTTYALTTSAAPDAANIEAGFDTAGGQVYGLAFAQITTPGSGSDTFRLKCEYRIIPLTLPD